MQEFNDVKIKKCTACLETKKLSEFSKNKRNKKDGRQSRCKSCNRAYYLANKRKIKEKVLKNYFKDHEKKLERRRELAQRPEVKQKKSEKDRIYYLKNKNVQKKWLEANRARIRAYWKKWFLDGVSTLQEYAMKPQRLKVINNGNNTLTLKQVEQLLYNHPYCEYCGKSKCKLTINHVIPISRGGQNCLSNITIACIVCNLSKNNKLLSEWDGPSGGFYKK